MLFMLWLLQLESLKIHDLWLCLLAKGSLDRRGILFKFRGLERPQGACGRNGMRFAESGSFSEKSSKGIKV